MHQIGREDKVSRVIEKYVVVHCCPVPRIHGRNVLHTWLSPHPRPRQRTGRGCHGNPIWVDISPRRGSRYLDSKRFIFLCGPPAGSPLLELPAFLRVKAARFWLCNETPHQRQPKALVGSLYSLSQEDVLLNTVGLISKKEEKNPLPGKHF